MDVLTFLQQGNVSANPDYNPKTKKGAIQPPFLVNYNPGQSTSDIGINNITKSAIPTIYDLNDFQGQQYYEHDVIPNYFDTEEELRRERAENQSAIEQFGRFATQVVGSEIVLGTARGFSDIADAMINIYSELAGEQNDYTNPISQALAEAQDDIRSRFEIYEENPDTEFTFNDLGWILNGATSIASTLSLAIPGTAVSKISKLAGVGKFDRAVGKLIGQAVGKPNMGAKVGEVVGSQLRTSAGMRVAENYIEARDTYETVYDEINNKLSAMTDKQFEQLINDNPQFAGKTKEEIAKYLAGESADDTFRNDMWLMALDMMQLRALKNIWRGTPSVRATSQLIRDNLNAGRRLVGVATESPSTLKRIMPTSISSTAKTVGAELSEGFEESWQYIQQQMSIDNARAAIDDTYNVRTLNDYLSDPQMWENAFWGWIGGLSFQGIAGASGRAWNKYVTKAKDSTYEGRKAEIDGRAATLNRFATRMNLLNQNLDPDRPFRDRDGNVISGDNEGYEEIDNTTRDAKKQAEVEALVTNLTLDAANAGNYNLLKDFVRSEDFAQYMRNVNVMDNVSTQQLLDNIVSRIDKTYEIYHNELNKIYKNDVANPAIAMQIARENTWNKLASDTEQRIINGYTTNVGVAINDIQDNTLRERASNLDAEIERAGIASELDYIDTQRKIADESLNNKEISRLEHRNIMNELAKKEQMFIQAAGYQTRDQFNEDNINHLIAKEAIEQLNSIDKNLTENSILKSAAQRRKLYIDSNIANNKKEIIDRSKFVENQFKIIQDEAFHNVIEQLDNIFDNNNADEVQRYMIYKNNDTNISDADKATLNKLVKELNLLDSGSEPLSEFIGRRARDARRKAARKPAATVNGERTDVVPSAAANADEAPASNDDGQAPPSTGGQNGATGETNNTDNITASNTADSQPETKPEGIAGSSPVEDETSPDKALESIIARRAAEEEAVINASSNINNYLLNVFLKQPREDIVNANPEEQERIIRSELISNGITEEDIDRELPKQLSSIRYIYNAITNTNNVQSAITIDIAKVLTAEEEQLNTSVKNLIARYVESTNGININGKYAINIMHLMRYIRDNIYGEPSYDLLYNIYNIVRQQFREGIDGVQIIDNGNLRLDKGGLAQLVETYDTTKLTNDNNFGIPFNEQNKDAIETVLSSIISGTVLRAEAKERGVELYFDQGKSSIKIGFNLLATRTIDNNGFIFTTTQGLHYEIYKNGTNYSSTLDFIFDTLYPENGLISKEGQELLDIMLAVKSNEITEEQAINFANTEFGQRIIDEISGDKNRNYNNIIKIVNFLNRIYFYNNTDNYNDNYDSYIEYLAKQYSNFEMTEKIHKALREKQNVNIQVEYVSKGKLITIEPQQRALRPSVALANYNTSDYHLGVIPDDGFIEDANNGNVTSLRGFRRRQLLVIVPNGNNAPSYAELEPQAINIKEGLGQAIFDEVNKLIDGFLTNNMTYEELRDSLIDIFGIRNFVSGINVGEHNNKIIIYKANSNVPAITIYKYKNNSSELGNGITLNSADFGGGKTSFNGTNDTRRAEISTLLTNLFDTARYSMSYNFARQRGKNRYIKYDNGKITITLTNKTYDNYLDMIDANNMGRLRINKRKIGNTETNFFNDVSNRGNMQLKISYQISSPVESGNNAEDNRKIAVEEERNKGNRTSVNTNEFLRSVAPDINITSKIVKVVIPEDVNINIDDKSERDGYYEPRSNRIWLTNRYFDKAKGSSKEAVRIIIHEQIHRQISNNGVMKNQQFLDEIRTIRQLFDGAINGATLPQKLLDYADAHNYDIKSYIDNLNKFLNDPSYEGKSEQYILEEFIVESLTNPYLSQALNNIETEIDNRTNQPQNLWTRIINFIRELFNLGNINDNTLLEREYLAFANNFKDVAIEQQLQQDKIDNDGVDSAAILADTEVANKEDDLPDVHEYDEEINTDDAIDEWMDDIPMSALSINEAGLVLPTINSISQQLTATEHAEFSVQQATGQLNYMCY